MKASNNSFDAKTRGNTLARFGAIHYRYYWGTSRLATNLEQIASSAAGSPELLWSGCNSPLIFYSHQWMAASEGLVHFRAHMTWPWWASIRQKTENQQGLPAASEKGRCVRNSEISEQFLCIHKGQKNVRQNLCFPKPDPMQSSTLPAMVLQGASSQQTMEIHSGQITQQCLWTAEEGWALCLNSLSSIRPCNASGAFALTRSLHIVLTPPLSNPSMNSVVLSHLRIRAIWLLHLASENKSHHH